MGIDIAGKVALVTGANRGIGKAIVESFLAHGAKKIYLAVRKLDTVQPMLDEYGEKVVPLQLDVADAEAIKALPYQAPDVQILVNNAGVLAKADVLDPTFISTFEHELNINTFGLIRVVQAFLPVLSHNHDCAVVQLNSIASVKNFTDFTSYCASKAAAYSVTQGLRDRLSEFNIAVLSVHPGPIATDMANGAGFFDADPVSVVSEGIVMALAQGEFHLFPDSMAKQIWAQYEHFAQQIIETPASA
jgi:NAD(P)-dependent dehydrogenase (short-subunit alcohol dehydrogenase family)